MCIEPFGCSATQMLNGSCILGVVVGDSLIASPRVPNIFFLKTWSFTISKKILKEIKKAISKSF